MGLQSDGKKVADVGLKGKTNLELKVLIMCCVTILKCCLILTKIFEAMKPYNLFSYISCLLVFQYSAHTIVQ